MNAFFAAHRIAAIALGVVAIMVLSTAGLLVAVESGHGRSLLIRTVTARTGRAIEIKGAFQAHLFSRHPTMLAEEVTIGNPPWMPPGVMAKVGRIMVKFSLPGSGEPSGIAQLSMQNSTFDLQRDPRGRANWQLIDPDKRRAHRSSWIIRSLSIPDAHVALADAYRHRQFTGTVSVDGPSDTGTAPPLRINGAGQLNGRAVTFKLNADSLATARHDKPYHFTFAERSSGSRLKALGFLPRPFDFTIFDGSFEATGEDLRDLYYLTGVRFLDTGRYHFSGKASRRGAHTEYRDLLLTTGASDVRGAVAIDSSHQRRNFDLALNSQALRLSDFGARAAGRATGPESPLLLSNAEPSTQVLRDRDSTIRFRAGSVQVGRVSLRNLSLRATADHGVLFVKPLLAETLGGSVSATLRLDARKDVPDANVELAIKDLQLGQLPSKDPSAPLFEGPLQAQVLFTGAGRSLHQVAASAHGTVRVQLPRGAMRASLAESAGGIDLRGLGLVLTHDQRQVQVRCASAEFKAEDGTLIAQHLVADTDPVLITGAGRIDLDTEALQLEIRGQAKKLRFLRLRAPVLVQGTLRHPSIAIEKGKSVPLLFEPGKAKDADCTEMLARENPVGALTPTPH